MLTAFQIHQAKRSSKIHGTSAQKSSRTARTTTASRDDSALGELFRPAWCAVAVGRRRQPDQLMHVVRERKLAPLMSRRNGSAMAARERGVNFWPLRYNRWSQALEVRVGELMPNDQTSSSFTARAMTSLKAS